MAQQLLRSESMFNSFKSGLLSLRNLVPCPGLGLDHPGEPIKIKSLRAHFNPHLVGFGIVGPAPYDCLPVVVLELQPALPNEYRGGHE